MTITASMSPLRPRKRSLANAKPAMHEVSTTQTVAVIATRKLLTTAWANMTSALSRTRRMLSSSWSPGVSGGGSDAISSFGREAMTSMK